MPNQGRSSGRRGWRPTCANEKHGYYCFWREVGKRMGIVDIPSSYEAFEALGKGLGAAGFATRQAGNTYNVVANGRFSADLISAGQ